MEERTLAIKDLRKEIIIILILGISSFYIFLRFELIPFPKGLLGIFFFSFPASITGGYLVARKSDRYRHAILTSAVTIVTAVIIINILDIITFIAAGVSAEALAGKVICLVMYTPIIFISSLIGAWIGRGVKLIFTKS